MKQVIQTFKLTDDFKSHIKKTAKKKGLNPSAYIKAVLKKESKYKEPQII